MHRKGRGYFSLLFFIIVNVNLFPQNLYVKVTDEKTREPLSFINVCVYENGKERPLCNATDIKGEASFNLNDNSLLVVSGIGYNSVKEMVSPGDTKHIVLKPKIFNLDEVTVTADFVPVKSDSSIYKVNVISSSEILKNRGSNLTSLLRAEPQFRLTYDPVLGTSLNIRGLKEGNIKIMIDGIPVPGLLGKNVDLDHINLNNVEHIEFIESPMSVIYGSNALGGAINIITRQPAGSKFWTNTQSYIESIGIYNFSAGLGAANKKHGIDLNVTRNFFTDYSYNDTARSMEWRPKEQYFGDLVYHYYNKSSKYLLKFSGFKEVMIDYGNLRPAFYYTAFDNYYYTLRYNILGDYELNKNGNTIKINGSVSNYNRIKKSYLKDLSTLEKTLINYSDANDTAGILNINSKIIYSTHPFNKFLLQAGVDVDLNEGAGRRIQDNKKDMSEISAFLISRFDLTNEIKVQTGLRYGYHNAFYLPVLPSFSFLYNNSGFSSRFSYVRGFRTPGINELYISFVDMNHNILPNPDLKPEKGNTFSLNIQYNSNKKDKLHYTVYDLDLYYNNFKDAISLASFYDPENRGLNYYIYFNMFSYNTYGINYLFRYKFYPRFDFSAGFTYNIENYKTTSSSQANEVNQLMLTANTSYKIPVIETELQNSIKYNGPFSLVVVENEKYTSAEYAGYTLWDISLNKMLLKNKLYISAGTNNLLNITNIKTQGNISNVHYNYGDKQPVAWGTTYYIKMKFTFTK